MNPQEEYIRRHGLSCPVVRRPQRRCYAIARAPRDLARSGWMIMQVELVVPNGKPPFYQVKWYQPTHSSQSGSMTSVLPDENVEWDNYERYMFRKMMEFPSLSPLMDQKSVQLALWEMFIFCCDEHFQRVPFGTQQLIWKTVDPELSDDERLKAQESCVPILRKTPQLFSRWESLKSYGEPENYADWFADVFSKIREASYYQQFCAN